MNKWYSIKNVAKQSGASEADVYIFEQIGYWDISARAFIDELRLLDVEQINLHINSPGGDVFDGVAIQNVLKNHQANVTVYIDGLAASIASIIALAGDTILIADNAYVMIHNPWSIALGDAKDMIKEAELLDKVADGIAGDYARRMGITVDEARELMDNETWYLGQEAVDAGFASSTYEGMKAAAGPRSFDIKRVSANAPAAVLERFANRVKDETEKENEMKKTNDSKPVNADENLIPATETPTEEAPVDAPETPVDAPADAPAEAPVDVAATVQAALTEERKRIAAVTELGNKFGFQDAAAKAITDGTSIHDFRAAVLAKSPDEWRASLAVKNPSVQASATETVDEEAAALVAKIKAARAKK